MQILNIDFIFHIQFDKCTSILLALKSIFEYIFFQQEGKKLKRKKLNKRRWQGGRSLINDLLGLKCVTNLEYK